MKYMSFIFENQDIRNTVANSEAIIETAFTNILNSNIVLESYIHNNLAQFTAGAESAADVYARIRDFIISENTAAYTQISEILADSELSADEKLACFSEGWGQDWMQSGGKAEQLMNSAAQGTKQAAKDVKDWSLRNGITGKTELTDPMTQNLRNFKGPDPLAKSLDPLGMKTAGTGMSGHAPPELSNSAARSEYVTRATSNNASGLDTVNNPVSEKFASALDHAKEIVSAHPWAAGGTGLAAAGLGAYGVYRAMKANKAAKK